jgi:hypothetical protein
MAKLRYFKLGAKASMFYDTSSRLKITLATPGTAPAHKLNKNARVISALAQGHIVEIDEAAYDNIMAKKGSAPVAAPAKDEEEEVVEEENETSDQGLTRDELLKAIEESSVPEKKKKKLSSKTVQELQDLLDEYGG